MVVTHIFKGGLLRNRNYRSPPKVEAPGIAKVSAERKLDVSEEYVNNLSRGGHL